MKSADIAAALVAGFQQQATGNTDVGYHLGVVEAYDDATGLNSVLVNGNTFDNLRIITSGPAITISVGDTVVLLRYQTQYFILGKIAAPGAGAAMRPKQAVVFAGETTSSTSYTDLTTVGPVVSSVYIGPSRQCLVLLSNGAINNNGSAFMSFQVTGASSISPSDARCTYFQNPSNQNIEVTMSQSVVLTAADGLTQGFNTFTAKYKKGGTTTAYFDVRTITVFPF